MAYPRLLFICAQGRLRSRSAAVARSQRGRPADFSGVDPQARPRIRATQIREAEAILCMEAEHARLLHEEFGPLLDAKPVLVLGIPDTFEFLDPGLLRLIRAVTDLIDQASAPHQRRLQKALPRPARLRALSDHAYDRYLALRTFAPERAEQQRRRFTSLYHQARALGAYDDAALSAW